MISSTSITLDLQSPNIAVVAAAKQNDSMSREIVATLKNGSDPFVPPGNAMVMIRYSKPDRTAGWYDTMEDETTPAYSITGNVVTILLCEQMLTVPGDVYVEINFYTQTERLSTFSFLLKVEKSVLSDNEIISSDYYNVLSQKIDALLGATTNPPQIDPTSKNWMLWNEDHGQYEDSGYSSIGTQGPVGPQGVSITSTSKASGTGAPGTTDTYNVNLSNNTVAGTFTVYNGMNGTGSVNSVNGTFPDQTGNVEVDIPASVYVGPSAPSDPDINIWFDTDDPGQSIVNSVNGKSGVAVLDSDDVGAMPKWVKIWENPSPTASFAAQTISDSGGDPLDISDYDAVYVICCSTALKLTGSAFIPKGYIQSIRYITNSSSNLRYMNRDIDVSSSTISVAAAFYMQQGSSSSTTDNTLLIPMTIYGIKGVVVLT